MASHGVAQDLADRNGISPKDAKRLIRKAKELLDGERVGSTSSDEDT